MITKLENETHSEFEKFLYFLKLPKERRTYGEAYREYCRQKGIDLDDRPVPELWEKAYKKNKWERRANAFDTWVKEQNFEANFKPSRRSQKMLIHRADKYLEYFDTILGRSQSVGGILMDKLHSLSQEVRSIENVDELKKLGGLFCNLTTANKQLFDMYLSLTGLSSVIAELEKTLLNGVNVTNVVSSFDQDSSGSTEEGASRDESEER